MIDLQESQLRIDMKDSKLYMMENHETVQENPRIQPASEGLSIQVRLPACGNDAVKQEMAVALIAQGLSEESVCRLLHIDSELLPG